MIYTLAHLATADAHVAESTGHVARQKEIIVELRRKGYPTELALTLLRTFELTLESHHRHREQIVAELL